MEKLKQVIENHGRWHILMDYIERIESYRDIDYSLALENAKALLESIAKEICKIKEHPVSNDSNMSGLLKNAFIALDFAKDDAGRQISTALGTIGQKFGEIRNEIGSTAHGKTLEEFEKRNSLLNQMTQDFLLNTTVSVGCFLINLIEVSESGNKETIEVISYTDNDNFNEFWDSIFGEFGMGEYSYPASEILYNTDQSAYITELKTFELEERDMN